MAVAGSGAGPRRSLKFCAKNERGAPTGQEEPCFVLLEVCGGVLRPRQGGWPFSGRLACTHAWRRAAALTVADAAAAAAAAAGNGAAAAAVAAAAAAAAASGNGAAAAGRGGAGGAAAAAGCRHCAFLFFRQCKGPLVLLLHLLQHLQHEKEEGRSCV